MSDREVDTKREAERLPMGVTTFMRFGKPWRIPPKGWREQSGGVHLGAGVWLLRYERVS